MLHIHGAPVVGRYSAGGSVGADLSDIDLTAAKLDSRIKFICVSSRAYHAANDMIQFADPNVWPVEWRNGVAVGRHEPEQQSTNYMLNIATPEAINRATASGGTLSAERVDGAGIPTARFTFTTPTESAACYSLIGGNTAVGAGDVVYSVFVRSGEPSRQIVLYADSQEFIRYDISTDIRRLMVKTSVSYETRYSWCGLRNLAGNLVAEISGYQVEPGQFSTSPILTGTTAVTRAAAFASVTNPGGAASGIQIWYTDGTVLELDFSGADSVDIPASTFNWGTRYIERITYTKAATDPLRDIDMLSPVPDTRINYVRPGKLSYYAADGGIAQAAPNVWPQEFIDGVAVGRHEPESQATNYVAYSNDLSRATIYAEVAIAPSGTTWRGLPGYALSGPYSYSFAGIATFTAVAGQHYTLSVIADLSTAQQLRFEFNRSSTARRGYVFTTTAATESITDDGNIITLHGYKITQLSAGIYRFSATASFSATGVVTLRIGANKNDIAAKAIVYFSQAEDGDIATSPIMTIGAAATRPAAFASVRVYQGAIGLNVTYSDGTTSAIMFDGNEDGYCQLPQASADWGTRYITRISYIKGG